MRIILVADVPVGCVRPQGGWPRAPWVHVLDGESNVGDLSHARDAVFEGLRVFALPAKWRMNHDGLRPECFGCLPGSIEFAPRICTPHALGDEQARSVDGQHGNLVVIDQPLQRGDVLTHGIGAHHHLDTVVAQRTGELESHSGGFREHRGRG